MPRSCFQGCTSFLLRFLNFVQIFLGIAIILYSVWMINQWNHHRFPGPSPLPSESPGHNSHDSVVFTRTLPFTFEVDSLAGLENEIHLHLPVPWFIYFFMAGGILLCCITCIGHIAAEALSGCCLCFYTLLMVILMLLEATFVGFLAVDRGWEEDLPPDPTGEIENLRLFMEKNADICKWVGITVVIIQALSLLLSMILRATVSTRRLDYDSEDEDDVQHRAWEPLLNSHSTQISHPARADAKGTYSETWNSKLRDKYGLNASDNQKA